MGEPPAGAQAATSVRDRRIARKVRDDPDRAGLPRSRDMRLVPESRRRSTEFARTHRRHHRHRRHARRVARAASPRRPRNRSTRNAMNTATFDTCAAVKTLREAGAGEAMAEAIVNTVSATAGVDRDKPATKADPAGTRTRARRPRSPVDVAPGGHRHRYRRRREADPRTRHDCSGSSSTRLSGSREAGARALPRYGRRPVRHPSSCRRRAFRPHSPLEGTAPCSSSPRKPSPS